MPTDTIDIYSPGNEAAWERAVRDALDKVRPGMGERAEFTQRDTWRHQLESEFEPGVKIMVWFGPRHDPETGCWVTGSKMLWSPEPIGAICLALCEYRRQRQTTTTPTETTT